MNRNVLALSRLLLVCLASLLCVPLAQARNTMLLLLIDPVLRQTTTRQMLGEDVALQFGAALPEGAEPLQTVESDGLVRSRYAVDDRVVWTADVDKRIGRSSQLLDK